MHVAPDAADLPPDPPPRGEDETDERYAERAASFAELLALPDAPEREARADAAAAHGTPAARTASGPRR